MDDPYEKHTVTLAHHGGELRLHVAHDLFSSHEVDVGTRLLLRTLAGVEAHRVLDLGCGYGPLGLALKQADPARTVQLVDRDALALEFARRNAELNVPGGVEVCASLGYDDVRAGGFDLIVSNMPAKAGAAAVRSFLVDAGAYLASEGLVAVVVIDDLAPGVAALLEETPEIEVVFRKATARYAAFHYRFAGEPAARGPGGFERGVYRRDVVTLSLSGRPYTIETAYDLPAPEGPDARTGLLIDELASSAPSGVARAVALNPGQGYLPVVFWALCEPATIELVDRDLLALRQTERNLVANGCPGERIALSHRAGLGDAAAPADLIVGVLREAEGTVALAATLEQAARRLAWDGLLLLGASSTAATRVERLARTRRLLRVEARKRRKGNSVLALRRRS